MHSSVLPLFCLTASLSSQETGPLYSYRGTEAKNILTLCHGPKGNCTYSPLKMENHAVGFWRSTARGEEWLTAPRSQVQLGRTSAQGCLELQDCAVSGSPRASALLRVSHLKEAGAGFKVGCALRRN